MTNRTRPTSLPRRLAALVVFALFATSTLASIASADSPRKATVAALEALESAWPGQDVSIRILRADGKAEEAVRIGDEIVYRFGSSSPGYLTALHVDTHGATTLLYPRRNAEDSRISADRDVDLPNASDGFELEVRPPVGRDLVFAVVTRTPIERSQLGISSSDVVVAFEPQDGALLVRRLREALDARPREEVAVAHVAQRIDGRGKVLYRSADIVGFFGERTRSIRPPKLDLQIQFATDSAELDDAARRNVDEFADALGDPKLLDTRFVISGHTDETGPDDYNLRLARARAEAVRRYLVDPSLVDQERLEIEAHGENAPLMTEGTAYARQMNRRVEFKPVR